MGHQHQSVNNPFIIQSICEGTVSYPKSRLLVHVLCYPVANSRDVGEITNKIHPGQTMHSENTKRAADQWIHRHFIFYSVII